MKKIQKKVSEKGFTLVELMLVIAIIGILSAIVMVGIRSSRERAKATSTLTTMRSAVPYAVKCYLNESPLSSPVAGTKICPGSSVDWPELKYGCTAVLGDASGGGAGSGYQWRAECHTGANPIYIFCDASGKGKCCILDENNECVN